jgi:hypothetical protein
LAEKVDQLQSQQKMTKQLQETITLQQDKTKEANRERDEAQKQLVSQSFSLAKLKAEQAALKAQIQTMLDQQAHQDQQLHEATQASENKD